LYIVMGNNDDVLNENNEIDVRNDVLLLHRGQLVRKRLQIIFQDLRKIEHFNFIWKSYVLNFF